MLCANKDTSFEASSACHRRTNWGEHLPSLLTLLAFQHLSCVSFLSTATCEPQRRRSVQDLPGISTEHRESNHVRKHGHFLCISHTWVGFGTQSIWVKVPGSSQKKTGISCCIYKTQLTLDICVIVCVSSPRGAGTVASPPAPWCPLTRQASEVTSPLMTQQVLTTAKSTVRFPSLLLRRSKCPALQ